MTDWGSVSPSDHWDALQPPMTLHGINWMKAWMETIGRDDQLSIY